MGEVYAAYDPELDRKIALKLLRFGGRTTEEQSEGRQRLLREAQAIARLSDPHVVVVYDVGTYQGRVFLAMEFVDGSTLGFWLQSERRPGRAIVRNFIAAGRGLAAAHRAGLVHRDFKPDNVMIGRDGDVRVMDFGLARITHDHGPSAGARPGDIPIDGAPTKHPSKVVPIRPPQDGDDDVAAVPVEGSTDAVPSRVGDEGEGTRKSHLTGAVLRGDSVTRLTGTGRIRRHSKSIDRSRPHNASRLTASQEDVRSTRDLSSTLSTMSPQPGHPLSSNLTESGALMGTPAYMAPEQFAGQPAEAASDQFGFCVALYEGLYGQTPFGGNGLTELTRNVMAGRVRPPPPNHRVPTWLRRVLLRGLSVKASDRFASMDDLLAALERDPRRRRRRQLAWMGAAFAICLMTVGLVRVSQRGRRLCAAAGDPLNGIWEGSAAGLTPRKQMVQRAFLASGRRYAASAFASATSALDRYADQWIQMGREVCEATHVRGEQSGEVLDLRSSCLQERLVDLRALTSVFANADGDVVAKAAQATQSLRSVDPCADVANLMMVAKPPEDPAAKAAVADVRIRLAHANALARAGRYSEADELFPGVIMSARDTKYSALIAEALSADGRLANDEGDGARAETSYEEALWQAKASRDDGTVAEAAAQLVYSVGFLQHRPADGQRWADFASALLRRLGPKYEIHAASKSNNLSAVMAGMGQPAEALRLAQDAVEIASRLLGPEHFDVAISRDNASLALDELGRVDEAIAENEEAIAAATKSLGPEHPALARLLVNGASFRNQRGEFAKAVDLSQRALDIWGREVAKDGSFLAYALTERGIADLGLGRVASATERLTKALAIWDRVDAANREAQRTRFGLAQALMRAPTKITREDRNRAIALAQQAAAGLRREVAGVDQSAEIEAWIEDTAHSAPRSL